MQTFYSILSVEIRPEIDEKISVGLLMVTNNKVSFYISDHKLSVVKRIVSTNLFKGVKNAIKHINRSFSLNQENYKKHQVVLELNIEDKSDIFNYQYIDYLSKYNNNLVTFSKPIAIDLLYSTALFKSLFEKYVDSLSFYKKPVSVTSIERFKRSFYPKVKKYFNIDKEIDSLTYPKLIMPVKMDLMGKNEIEVFGQSIDMTKNKISIEHGIAELLLIHRALPKAKQFIISSEPDKSNIQNHRIWNNIRKMNTDFEYVDINESERISEYAKEHGVLPLIDLTK